MNLITLLERVPPLLDACILDNTHALRCMRLVDKEASRVALLGLRTYSLNLNGDDKDTNISGTNLLQGTKLAKLKVTLKLSGVFSPAVMLKAFVIEVGASLSTVTTLDIRFSTHCGTAITSSVVQKAMASLVSSCSALTSMTSHGPLSPEFLQCLGEACPLLSKLTIIAGNNDLAYLQRVFSLQPSLLPNVYSVNITRSELDIKSAYELPSMIGNIGILTLELRVFYFTSPAQWLHLPPSLQHLSCFALRAGPEHSSDDGILLASLQSLTVTYAMDTPLHALAAVLHSAPVLCSLNAEYDDALGEIFQISCRLNQSTAADLRLLLRKTQAGVLKSPCYKFDCGNSGEAAVLQPIIAAFPHMLEVTYVKLRCFSPTILCDLLKIFLDVERLKLDSPEEMDDVQLQDVVLCEHLQTLELTECNEVSPMGLLTLCLRLPGLARVSCRNCDQLTDSELERCMHLLRRHGLMVDLVTIT